MEKVCQTLNFPAAILEIYDEATGFVQVESQVRFFMGSNSTEKYLPEESPLSRYLGLGDDTVLNKSSGWGQVDFKTVVSLPLINENRIFGLFSVAHPEPDRSTSKTSQWISSVATQLSYAINSKQLREVVRNQEIQMIGASKMSELGRMAGSIAHEINTPLATISLITDHLETLILNKNYEKEVFLKSLKQVKSTVFRIAKIITGLRTFSRDGNQDPFASCHADQIILETLTLCREKLRKSHIKIKTSTSSEMILKCKSVQITQVLINLLNNAVDAIAHLPNKWIQIDAQVKDQFIEFSVTDCVGGISVENQEKLFQPFFITKEVGEGTGLGLSVSLGIARAHRGVLRYDSTNQNTKFILTLPVDPEQATAKRTG